VSIRVGVPVAPDVRYSTHVGGKGRRSGGGRGRGSGGGGTLLGAVIVLMIAVVLLLIALPVGGLILIGVGVYIGVLTHRSQTLAADPPTVPIPVSSHAGPAVPAPAPVRKFFGLDPSYGLSTACVGVGVLMFISGVALLGSSDTPPSPTTAPAYSSTAPAAPPTTTPPVPPTGPAVVAPDLDPAPAPTAEAVQPRRVAEPAEVPAERTARPQPATPDESAGDDGGDVYYKNCAAARAAGAAPIQVGEPGYRPALDRDGDGTACDQ